jgi:large subunit ribosomal protein L25
MDTLQTERRDMTIKAKKLRNEGYVPGNIFGHAIEGSIPVKINARELEKLLKTNDKGSRINLLLDGKTYNVLIKETQYDSMKRRYNTIDFQALVSGEMVQTTAKIEIINRDEVKEGILEQELEEISYSALPEDLADKVVIDAAELKLEEKVLVKDLALAKNPKIHLHTDPEAIVAVVARAHKVQEEEPAAAAEETPAAEA